MERRNQSEEPVGEAIAAVIAAGQHLLAQRLELAILEGRQLAVDVAIRCALVFLGGLVLLGALLTIDIALVSGARTTATGGSGWTPLLCAAAAHVLIGAGLLWFAARKA